MAGGHGGPREGSGRPPVGGLHKALKVPLELDDWRYIDMQIKQGNYKSYAEFFRRAAEDRLRDQHNWNSQERKARLGLD